MARISKEEKDRIRQRIIEVAREGFMIDGYEETSTKKIAQQVGIAEGTLFNYFDTKSELFLEAVGYEIEQRNDITIENQFDNISKAITDHMLKMAGILLKIPKRFLLEIVNATFKMAKKNPKRLHQFAQMDLKYMKDIELYFDSLIEMGRLLQVDTKQFSEIMYGIMAFELMMYLYNKETKKEEMLQNIETKIHIVLQGYVK